MPKQVPSGYILMAEDIPVIQKLLALYLKDHLPNKNILITSKVNEAIELFRKHCREMDFVLIDGSIESSNCFDTLPLAIEIGKATRDGYFQGMAIAISGDEDRNEAIIAACYNIGNNKPICQFDAHEMRNLKLHKKVYQKNKIDGVKYVVAMIKQQKTQNPTH